MAAVHDLQRRILLAVGLGAAGAGATACGGSPSPSPAPRRTAIIVPPLPPLGDGDRADCYNEVQGECLLPAYVGPGTVALGPFRSDGQPGMCCYIYSPPSDFDSAEETLEPLDVIPGRPFVVVGAPRIAPVASLSGWSTVIVPRIPADPELRHALAAHWTRAASFEHASVASFARFTMDLLAVGAPADLVAASQQAGLDEVRHAKLCFSLASAYAGRPIGPGLFRVPEEPDRPNDLASLAAAAVREGCVAETLAALDVATAAERVEDPVVRETLQAIAADEAAHAVLAWRFVRWALEQGGAEVREAVAEAFSEAERLPSGVGENDGQHEAWGVLGTAARRRVMEEGLREVVAPAARGMLATTGVGDAA